MSEFSIRSMKKTIEGETDKRVSEDAAIELGKLVEEYAKEIAVEALEIAHSDDRVTVRESDMRKALNSRRKLVVEEEMQ